MLTFVFLGFGFRTSGLKIFFFLIIERQRDKERGVMTEIFHLLV